MLDNITKKNIDDCRDVLVGKVPDPKSQIEQITLALIYKFMDDMDKEAVEKFKGKAKFFSGEYAKYGWRKLFDPSLSGQDMLALYSEALEKLNTNPNIPELFRNIFKNAYLPYRDPSTLKLFLKYINEFEYSHSEKLGDAFEYLLSVMGSQGDAGQFRTPRHIIDFVTACVNPQKNETVLDPACGTAGFLLSAYKHILNQNTDKRQGDKLKPDDRKKLATNFVGYDISPDMVRLSLANMYLHGFATPLIHEYDSLSSEDRWQETFDVILANPPFMTPKGGIRPHKKFGVQANKAEVLFTDYIAEHLNSNGRAGIVVPNGIVATSQTAYKQLRKMLVQDSLIAVISLPAGVFQPYSGVKTSVLILDKRLAKKSQHILFLKIEKDGFDLGAQRREIDKKLVEIGEICHIQRGGSPRPIEKFITTSSDGINWIKIGDTNENAKYVTKTKEKIIKEGLTKTRLVEVDDFILSNSMSFGRPYIMRIPGAIHDGWLHLRIKDREAVDQDYLYEVLRSEVVKAQYEKLATGGVVRNLNSKLVSGVKIPLPPIEIQQQIVTEIEGYQKIIDGAKQIVNNYKPSIRINPDWELATLDSICDFIDYRGKTPTKTEFGIRLITAKNVRKGYIDIEPQEFIATDAYETVMTRGIPKKGDVLFTTEAPLGNVALLNLDEKISLAQRIILLRPKNATLLSPYLVQILLDPTTQRNIENYATGSTVLGIKQSNLRELLIPIPPIEEQISAVKRIEKEQALVNGNKKLIVLFEQKIKNKINEVWGVKEKMETA
jgi:type I restriction enzyme M protein